MTSNIKNNKMSKTDLNTSKQVNVEIIGKIPIVYNLIRENGNSYIRKGVVKLYKVKKGADGNNLVKIANLLERFGPQKGLSYLDKFK
jgi:hypothetical protein